MRRTQNRAALRIVLFAATMVVGCGQSETPTSPTTSTPSPVSVTYSTSVGPHGSVSRSFVASQVGTVTVTLVAAGPPSTIALGVGVGIPRADGSGCTVAVSVITPAGPDAQLSTTVDAGNYCMKVFAVDGLTDPVAVTVTLVHP